MKHFSNVRILIAGVVMLLVALTAAAVERPFACHGNGSAVFITNSAGQITGANLTASGTATHLGMWTAVGAVQFAPDPSDPTKAIVTGGSTFTAANGDKLETVIANGTLDATTGVGIGVVRFVGGTGRFAAASGSANIVVTQNLATGAFELTEVGTIDF